ncbi:MAG: SEC-C metal-binding domain-containing protein [Acidimicrobiales bacterium]
MGDAERFEFVFGSTIDRSAWDEADHEERLDLLVQRFEPRSRPQLVMLLGVVEQLLAHDAPHVWATAQRLARSGLDAKTVIGELGLVFAQTVVEGIKGKTFDEEAHRERLDRLPLPGRDEIEEALLGVAREATVLPTGDLISRAAQCLGFPADDPMIVQLVEIVEEDLAEEFGPLAWLAGARTVHVETLCAGIVLTHVLSEAERRTGALNVSFDLAVFGWVDEPAFEGEPLDPISAEGGHLAWMGPDGWLERFEAGAILAVSVGPDDAVEVQVLAEEPPVDDALVELVREVYDEEVAEPQLPVSGEDLVLGLLVRDRTAFDRPQAPLSTLCRAAGLEKRASQVAHDPEVWRNSKLLSRYGRLSIEAGDDIELVATAVGVLGVCDQLLDGEAVANQQVGDTLEELCDLDVLALVTDELFDPRWAPATFEPMIVALLGAASRPHHRAAARLVAALDAEAAGDWVAAEQHLELAVEADPGFVPSTDRLAWYASDRGDALRATKLWRSCPLSPSIAQHLANVEPLSRARHVLGRNERCWCGSGRKYKQCHLGVPEQVPLAERVGWLCRKAVGYLERVGPEARRAVMGVAWARVPDEADWEDALDDPLVMDLVLTEGGWFQRFLADRGALLPDDEALLASSWLAVDRSVHEIVSVTPDVGLTLRDLRTGDMLDVRERAFTHQARAGMLICARPVPDGESNQLVGGIFPVAPGTEAALLDLLDRGDPPLIATWARELHARPELRTREGEVLVECEITITTPDVARLVAHLDAHYRSDVAGQAWTESHDLDDIEAVIRASFHLDGHRLTITTNSHERADRILDRLHAALDIAVDSDRRAPVDLETIRESARHGLPDLRNVMSDAGPELPDDAIEQIQAQMEARWCGESVLALGGLTPRQAAADPTRREQLERLLASFDAMETPPGAFSMRPDHLRSLLGL